MKTTQRESVAPAAVASFGILLVSVLLLFLYGQSGYLPYVLSGLLLLMLALVNLLLILFSVDPTSRFAPGETEKRSVYGVVVRIFRPMQALLLAEVIVVCIVLAAILFFGTPKNAALSHWHLVLLATAFVGAVILDKYCKHVPAPDRRIGALLRNARSFLAITKLLTVLLSAAAVLKLVSIADIQRYLSPILAVFFCYVAVMTVFSLAVRFIRKEMASDPGVVILLPFLQADIKELAVLSFLEENTGITLRSLWSLRYMRSLIPFAVLGTALLLWLSSGVVYVQSHQQAAVYRFGQLTDRPLSPGLHFTLPYPFDKSVCYDTQTIQKLTVGYKSTENVDNVWTESHGEEYKLLLGSGNELVSINLRIEYCISDLNRYLKFSSSPERLLEAKAYELVTDLTISTDLETILSVDRETFADDFKEDLKAKLAPLDTGLSVVNVILESIHPPVEVAEVYQAFIGAEIDAEAKVLAAQGAAAAQIAEAETYRAQWVLGANADYFARISAARTEVAEFMAAVEAYSEYPDEYVYYRYLNAITAAYAGSKLIILGDGVDDSRLYYGNFIVE